MNLASMWPASAAWLRWNPAQRVASPAGRRFGLRQERSVRVAMDDTVGPKDDLVNRHYGDWTRGHQTGAARRPSPDPEGRDWGSGGATFRGPIETVVSSIDQAGCALRSGVTGEANGYGNLENRAAAAFELLDACRDPDRARLVLLCALTEPAPTTFRPIGSPGLGRATLRMPGPSQAEVTDSPLT
jgi:hypothetical protein